jgi:prepilin-type N-terminal cleavage/methylation domain-containing protein
MIKISSKNGFSLIELIIAIVLLSVVLLGIFSINSVLNNNNQDYGQKFLIKSDTQNTLNHILNNVALAVGSVNPNDEAILIGTAGVGNANSFCIHQAGTTRGGTNGVNSTSDIWLCYSWAASQINWCAETYSAGTDPRGAASCAAASGAGHLIAGTSITFLGTAKSDFSNPAPSFVINGAQLLFSISIENCLTNSATSCNGDGNYPGLTPTISSDSANNPEVVVSGSTIPMQVSNY